MTRSSGISSRAELNAIELSRSHWLQLQSNLPASVENIFRTDTLEDGYWRELLAFNPVATFTLNSSSQLGELKGFLKQNQANLCAGYLSYDLGLDLKNVKSRHKHNSVLAVIHAYSGWAEFANDCISVSGKNPEFEKEIEVLLTYEMPRDIVPTSLGFETTLQQFQYKKAIQRIKEYIRAGDFYQINFTQVLKALTSTPARSLYGQLISKHPAAYAAYFESEDLSIHSLSPELFLHYSKGELTTEPIKGTRPRGRDENEDLHLKQALLESEKEQAELYMITDLLRNDLGEVCEIGSVKLEAIKEIRGLPKVWHTCSRIKGRLDPRREPVDALFSMFPGGSITGCPKQRALEVIDELESSSRGIYTGSIGYFHPEGDYSFNIAIRTLIQRGSDLSLGSGGGITIDSEWQDEWNELLVKASTFE